MPLVEDTSNFQQEQLNRTRMFTSIPNKQVGYIYLRH
jgi:hypothetical protein